MTTATAEKEPENDLEIQVQEKVSAAGLIMIETDQDYIDAGEFLKSVKGKIKGILGIFEPIKKKSLAAHRENLLQHKKLEEPLLSIEKAIKVKMIVWHEKQEAIRLKQQAILDAQARKREEEEILAEAIQAEEDGDHGSVDQILSEPVIPDEVILPTRVARISGQSFSTNYKAEVVDLKELLKAVIAGKVSIMAIKANDVFLNQQAKSLKATFSIPGVKLVKKKIMTAAG